MNRLTLYPKGADRQTDYLWKCMTQEKHNLVEGALPYRGKLQETTESTGETRMLAAEIAYM